MRDFEVDNSLSVSVHPLTEFFPVSGSCAEFPVPVLVDADIQIANLIRCLPQNVVDFGVVVAGHDFLSAILVFFLLAHNPNFLQRPRAGLVPCECQLISDRNRTWTIPPPPPDSTDVLVFPGRYRMSGGNKGSRPSLFVKRLTRHGLSAGCCGGNELAESP